MRTFGLIADLRGEPLTGGARIHIAAAVGAPLVTTDGGAVCAAAHVAVTAAGVTLMADARLDHRDDLRRALAATGQEASGVPGDAGLILDAYRAWGTDCAAHLDGDFAFVIWDPAERRLFAARDVFGVRPLFYAYTGRHVAVASRLAVIREVVPASDRLNLPFLRAFLHSDLRPWRTDTALAGAKRVPAGHVLTATAAGVDVRPYHAWRSHGTHQMSPKLFEEFRHHVAQAVRSRLDDGSGLLVSGGLDSSALAVEAVAWQQEADRSLVTVSTVYERTRTADERSYLEALLSACGSARPVRMAGDDWWGLQPLGDDDYPMDEPDPGYNRTTLVRPFRAAASAGCPVVLTGHWGDQLFSAGARPSSWVARARHAWRGWRDAALDPVRDWPEVPTDAAPSLRLLTDGSTAARLAQFAAMGTHFGLEPRFPYLDRRLVQFMLDVPANLRIRDGWTKWILRQAYRGRLPEPIRQRRDKAYITSLGLEGMRREHQRLTEWFARSLVVDAGLIERRQLERRLERMPSASTALEFRGMTRIVAVEQWLRNRNSDAARLPQVTVRC